MPSSETTSVEDFYPRPPRGGRQSVHLVGSVSVKFLSTPSARRATDTPEQLARYKEISIHALREEGDPGVVDHVGFIDRFLSTPSARRATTIRRCSRCQTHISIHALREEGDVGLQHDGVAYTFLSTPSARRATLMRIYILSSSSVFLSTPSARRATKTPIAIAAAIANFYPRPPRGGRPSTQATGKTYTVFLSTPSARRATPADRPEGDAEQISIHALREEGDMLPSTFK